MAGAYRVGLRPEVLTDDLPLLPRNLQSRILRAVESRLATEPGRYGVRLRRSLSGFWKLRVGDYRVVYEIEGSRVTVLVICHRKRVYETADKRIK